jgi:hypothetical protein
MKKKLKKKAPRDAATGLFQPSESPAAPVEFEPGVVRANDIVENLRDEVSLEERMGEVHEGKVYSSPVKKKR